MSEETIVISGEAAMEHFRMCQVIAALRIETTTGMSHSRGSVLQVARDRYGIKARTKKEGLAKMKELYEQTYGHRYGELA